MRAGLVMKNRTQVVRNVATVGKRHKEGKELVGYIIVKLWRRETVLLAGLQWKGIKLGKISTVKVKM